MLWKPNWKVFILCIEHFYVLLECFIQIDDMNVVMNFYDECAFCIIKSSRVQTRFYTEAVPEGFRNGTGMASSERRLRSRSRQYGPSTAPVPIL